MLKKSVFTLTLRIKVHVHQCKRWPAGRSTSFAKCLDLPLYEAQHRKKVSDQKMTEHTEATVCSPRGMSSDRNATRCATKIGSDSNMMLQK